MEHLAGIPGFSVAGTTTSEADGGYRFASEPIDVNASFYASVADAHSARHTARVGARVSIGGLAEGAQLIAGRGRGPGRGAGTVTFTGIVAPVVAGARVALERQFVGGEEPWRAIAYGRVASNGTYSIRHAFMAPGNETVRAVVTARGLHASVSQPLSFEVSQRQNPQLTIEASNDPLCYGQPVTLSGTAVGWPDAPVTLLARGGAGSFKPVATAMTDAAGNYAFPPQSPAQTTFYRVRSARAHSAELVEGVKPLLTAAVSQSSITEGQPLTFAGTVAPGRSGGAVLLERQDPSELGFRVVATGTIGTGSSFSLEYAPFEAGTQVFRIGVPGDSSGQAATSEPLTVQVTAIPTSAPESRALGAPASFGES